MFGPPSRLKNTLCPQLAAKQESCDTFFFSFKLSSNQFESFQLSPMSQISGHHRFHSLGSSVPFSWENSPGVSKIAPRAEDSSSAGDSPDSVPPPPPCPDVDSPRRRSGGRHSVHVPLPPCPFQPPLPSRYSGKGVMRRDEDPFLAAYMECTKSSRVKKKNKEGKSGGWAGLMLGLGLGLGKLSCKQGSAVKEDGPVRLSQVDHDHKKFHGRDERLMPERSQSQSQSQGSGRATKDHQRHKLITGTNLRV